MAILQDANDILIDFDGHISYLTDDKLYVYDDTDTTILGASLTSNNSDMGEPMADKLINYVDVDYVGAFNLTFYFDNVAIWTMIFTTKATRGTIWRDFPISKRKAFQKLKVVLTTSTPNTKIYGLEIDFSVLKRRRYN